MDRIAVIGASIAGVRAAEALRRYGYDGELLVVGAEDHFPPYDRPPLSKQVLEGTWPPDQARLVVEDIEAELRLGVVADSLDTRAGIVSLSGGDSVRFDGLIIATGSQARSLPLEPKPGVYTLRTIDDSLAIRQGLQGRPTVAIVGAGFIGLEVAGVCRRLGLDVTVVEMCEVPLERSLGSTMGLEVMKIHEDWGVKFVLGRGVRAIRGGERVSSLELTDGSQLAADVVIVGVGVSPATEWLIGSGVVVDDGVVCDSYCRALGHPNIVAAGDVARWFNFRFGRTMRVEHWTNAVSQADAAAWNLLGRDGGKPYGEIPYFWSEQQDVRLQFLGESGSVVRVVSGSVGARSWCAIYGRENVVVGALCVNSPRSVAACRRMIADAAAFSEVQYRG